MLKVPHQLIPATDEEPQPPPPHFPPRRVPAAMRAPRGPRGDELPRFVRILIWIVAVPLGFLLVFGATRFLGFLSQRQLEDTFLLSGWSRFWPIVRVLPFWALITALVVHFANIGIVRWRQVAKQRATRPGGASRSRRPINGRPRRGSALPRKSPTSEAPTRTSRVS